MKNSGVEEQDISENFNSSMTYLDDLHQEILQNMLCSLTYKKQLQTDIDSQRTKMEPT